MEAVTEGQRQPGTDERAGSEARDASNGQAVASLVLASLLWGGAFVLVKVALRELAVSHLIVLRFGFAMLGLLPVLARVPMPRRQDFGRVLATGVLAVPVTYLLQVQGLTSTSAASASLILGCLPPLLGVAAVWSGREAGAQVPWGALLLSTAGVAVLGGAPGPGRSWTGDALVFLSVAATAAWVLMSKSLAERYGPASATAYPLAA